MTATFNSLVEIEANLISYPLIIDVKLCYPSALSCGLQTMFCMNEALHYIPASPSEAFIMLADLQGADMKERDLPGFGHRGCQAFDLQVLDPDIIACFSELCLNGRITGKPCALLRAIDMLNAGVGDELRFHPHHQSAGDPPSSSELLRSPP